MRKELIPVMVAEDREFRNSYWSDIQKELRRTFREFKRQFGIGFRVTKVKEWDSIGSPDLRDFPLNVIRRLTKVSSEEELIEKLAEEIKQLEIPWKISQKKKERPCRSLGRKSKTYQWEYLAGFLTARLQRCLLKSLIEKIIKGEENEIVLGFTGKIIFPEHPGAPLGLSSKEDGYALIGISESPSYVILHELGHLFGAEHTKDESTVSVMNQKICPTYEFDKENKKIVRANLKKYQ